MNFMLSRFSKKIFILCPAIIILLLLSLPTITAQNSKYGLVIHGGAGTISRTNVSPEKEIQYKAKLTEALTAGYKILDNGGTALDAVETAIKILEDSPLFNAGKGAVLTNKGTAELDASIMDGKTLNAGSVAVLKHIKNPITLARAVMEKSPHVFLVGEGAEEFAKEQYIEFVEQEYFITKERLELLERIKQIEAEENKHGTVGAAALDKNGNLAAGTSTGGMMNKKFGRVGDVPVIGAGTYASNKTCAVSATGHGEYFIRLSVARDISDLIEYKNQTLAEASSEVINNKLTNLGGTGGIIAIDKDGNIAMPFNTEGMFRGYYISGSEPVVNIFK